MTDALERPIEAGWLALREPADTRARDAVAAELLPPLLDRLDRLDRTERPDRSGEPAAGLRVVDLGAGTGANLRWLAPRLPHPDRQQWMLVDHDPGLLARGPVQATAVRADVADLARVLADLGGADLVTAAALLDLLDPRQVTAIVDAVIQARVPALFSLSVSGEVGLDPADPQDGPLADAFDAHQRRDGRLGPDAGAFAARLFTDRGWSVHQARTPWRVDSDRDAQLVGAWLDGRAGAAVEHRPELAPAAAEWLARRRSTAGSGRLEAVVGHLDVLALPD
jgi:SAM-dependent methyltransferase